MNTIEGCASISDINGNLLLYCDGVSLFNAQHNYVPNGYNLLGEQTAVQAALILPQPSNDSLYFIFTNGNGKLYYSLVNILGNGGAGEILKKNILLGEDFSEKLASVNAADDNSIWVGSVKNSPLELYCYKLDFNGININPIISDLNDEVTGNTYGQLKFSNDGNFIGLGYENKLGLALFDNSTGKAHVLDQAEITQNGYVYGVEFSPDNKKIYCTSTYTDTESKLFQLTINNLSLGNLSVIYNNDTNICSLQLGCDGRLYASSLYSEDISFITYPNLVGSNVAYSNSGIYLNGKESVAGLPNYNASYFYEKNNTVFHYYNCIDNSYAFSLDGESNVNESIFLTILDSLNYVVYSSAVSPGNTTNYSFLSPGIYTIKYDKTDATGTQTFLKYLYVPFVPDIHSVNNFLGNDTVICSSNAENFTYKLKTKNTEWALGYIWNNVDTQRTSSIYVSKSGYYFCKIYNDCITLIDTIRVFIVDCTNDSDKYIYVPNIFTPNGDGINDNFQPIFIQNNCQLNAFKIYDRWGRQMFDTATMDEGWDGTKSNLPCEDGTYYYLIEYTLPDKTTIKIKKGFLELLK